MDAGGGVELHSMRSLIRNASEYMEELQRCFGDALEMLWRCIGEGAEFDMQGHTLTVWGSHMLSECDQPMNLTRYHNLPHLNLESRTSLTSYSSWLSMMMGPGCGGCGCSAMLSGM